MTIQRFLNDILLAVYGEEVRDAIHDAIAACYDDVSQSKTLSDTASTSAASAAALADQKAALAGDKAALADAAATTANTAAASANEKAILANSAAALANEKAASADTAAIAANTAAASANEKATIADDKAIIAASAASDAAAQAVAAYEAAQLVIEVITDAETATAAANNAAASATEAANSYIDASERVELAIAGASEASEIANTSAEAASSAASLATEKAALADTSASSATHAAEAALLAATHLSTQADRIEAAVSQVDISAEIANGAADKFDETNIQLAAALSGASDAVAEVRAELSGLNLKVSQTVKAVVGYHLDIISASSSLPDGSPAVTLSARLMLGVTELPENDELLAKAVYTWSRYVHGAWETLDGQNAKTLILSGSDVAGMGSYRCVLTGGAESYQNTLTLVDKSDLYQAVIDSTGGDVFKNTLGTSTLTCRLFLHGMEVDKAGMEHVYKWYRRDKDGTALDDGTPWKTGKFIEVSGGDINVKTIFTCEVT